MFSIVLVCFGLIAGEDAAKGSPGEPSDLAAYQAAASKAGRDAKAHVRLALWCEAHGMTVERVKHLATAVLADPSNILARGLSGMVAYKGKWDRPEVVGRRIEEDPAHRELINEYLDRRAKTGMKADAQARLAAWCEQKGLKEQAIAHYSEALRLDPHRDATWRHLGYKKQGNRWVKPEDQAADRLEAERQKHADRQWKPKLERIRDGLDSKDATRRAKAEEAAAEVTDPRAVAMVWAVMMRGDERSRMAGLQMFGQIDGPAASNALAALAVFNPSPEVRARALEILGRRDPRDVIGRLIGLVRKPFRYEVRPVNGPGSEGVLFVEGERFNIRRIYQDPPINPATIPPRLFAPWVAFDPYNLQNMMVVSAVMNGMTITPTGPSTAAAQQAGRAIAANPQNAVGILKNAAAAPAAPSFNAANSVVYNTFAAAAYRDMQIAADYQMIRQASQNMQQRLAQDVRFVEATNVGINQLNARVLPVLGMITGQDLGVEPEKWKAWWTDQLGYVYQSNIPETKPTYTDTLRVQTPFMVGTAHAACFAAGTMVITIDGLRPIESIQVGDRVLSQDPTTGQLSFRPVVTVHRNRPSPTLRIAIDGETIVATGIHRFWKAGQGWVMARDLKPGDQLRLVGATAKVRSIEPDATQPVYNLDVADDRDFFVGGKGLLVHDFSFVQPVHAPFDRAPDLPSPTASPSPAGSMLGPAGR
jgi:Pretoxin HINT domain